MKKIASLVALSALFSSAAFAATPTYDITTTLTANQYVAISSATDTKINQARQGNMVAVGNRAGFVKNNFDYTISANVIAGVMDNPLRSRFGVVAGSNKGYNVFTGSSVGGSISACGPQLSDKSTANLAASLVVAGTLNLENANGCGITTAP